MALTARFTSPVAAGASSGRPTVFARGISARISLARSPADLRPASGAAPAAKLRAAASPNGADLSTETLDPSILEAARDPAISQLAQQVLEAEAELQLMFEPGRPMPAASVVAKKRQQICDMKLLLAAKLNGQQTPVNPDASDGEAERARKLFLEVERSLQRQQRPATQRSPEYSFELSLLEAENDRLREKAEALLKRQALLEEIAQRSGLLTLRDGKLYWTKGQRSGSVARATNTSPMPAGKVQAGGWSGGVVERVAVQDRLELAAMSVASR